MSSQDTSAATPTKTLECGCEYTDQAVVTLPEVGPVCRTCHLPFEVDKWPTTVREQTVYHQTGESTTYRTYLLGLDGVGRAFYHDERKRAVLTVVPMHHRSFDADRSGDESPMRTYAPRHGAGRGKLVNGPDGRDLLVVIEQTDIDVGAYQGDEVVDWLISQWNDDNLRRLSDTMLERFQNKLDRAASEYMDGPRQSVETLATMVETLSPDH